MVDKTNMSVDDKLQKEIAGMQGFWRGGTTLSTSGFEATASMRKGTELHCDLRKIEEICINPYSTDAVSLDIGTNGGGWLLRMLPHSKKCHGMDILSAEHTGFWGYIPKEQYHKVEYHHVSDFSCSCLEDDSLDFVFSHDVFCHISFSGAVSYLESLFGKCKTGANLMISVADANKYSSDAGKRKLMATANHTDWDEFVADFDGYPEPGRWYFYGPDRFSEEAERIGYQVVNLDATKEHDMTMAMVHLRKP